MLVASKVTVSSELLQSGRLKGKKKTTLRRKLIMDYITQKPSGDIIQTSEFQRAGQFSTSANTHTFIKRMMRDGLIMRHAADKPFTYFYTVPGAARVVRSADITPVPEPIMEPVSEEKLYPQILRLAQEFVWEKRSINLRDFVEYVRVLEGGKPKANSAEKIDF